MLLPGTFSFAGAASAAEKVSEARYAYATYKGRVEQYYSNDTITFYTCDGALMLIKVGSANLTVGAYYSIQTYSSGPGIPSMTSYSAVQPCDHVIPGP
jgi:hypothetical protein